MSWFSRQGAAVAIGFCGFLFGAEEKLLFDFRGSHASSAPAMAAETRRNLLSAVFPQSLEDQADCEAGSQLGPEIVSRAAGSFTRPGARQLAYLIKVGECSAPGRSYLGAYRLAVFEGGRLIAAGQSPAGGYIDVAADVDGDGIEEMLVSGCGFGQGTLECSATLLSIAGGSLRTIQDFPGVYVDECESSRGAGINASVIRYARAPPARFFRDEYTAACPGSGRKPQFRPAASP